MTLRQYTNPKIFSTLAKTPNYEILQFLNTPQFFNKVTKQFVLIKPKAAHHLRELLDLELIQKIHIDYTNRMPYSITPRGREVLKSIKNFIESEKNL